MRKWIGLFLGIVLLCVCMVGCNFADEFWIQKNEPVESDQIHQTTDPTTVLAETEAHLKAPDRLQLDGTVTEEPSVCFDAVLRDLGNDIGYHWGRFLPEELWSQTEERQTPYSRERAQYRQLDPDPMLKNEPPICAYLSADGRIYEVSTILLTHDWTEAREENFLQRGETLLKCFWPDCGEEQIKGVLSDIRRDIAENLYRDNEDIPRPVKVYIYGSAAAYGYTLGNHISMNVIPVVDSRVKDMEAAGIKIVSIS